MRTVSSMSHRLHAWRRVACGLGLAGLASGCDDSSAGPGRTRHIGFLVLDRSVISAPDTAAAGSRIAVEVTTFGDGNCTQPAGATVGTVPPDPMSPFVAPPARLIVPYDYQVNGACTRDLVAYPRTVRFTAPTTPGRLALVVRGRSYAEGNPTVEVRDSIVIR